MKINNILTALIVSIFILSSCTKDASETIPTRNQDGDYTYSSSSTYYSNNNAVEHESISDGELYTTTSSTIDIQLYPNLGYPFIIEGSNLQVHGDTTTFNISVQQISIQNKTFTVRGAGSINVGSLGNFDGYFTNSKIVFAYKSSNIETYEWVETRTEAIKKN